MRFDESLAPDYPDLPKGLSPEAHKDWIFQRFVKDHYRAMAGVDENIGRVLDYLDRRKLAQDTLVIYTTDNGFFLGEHGWYDKRFMYEPAVLIVSRYHQSCPEPVSAIENGLMIIDAAIVMVEDPVADVLDSPSANHMVQVLDYLDRKKLAQDTLVIYTTDNGFFLGEHGWYDKRFMYEPALRLPLLVRYPRASHAGRVESRFALNIDYAPTMLDIAGVPTPSTMQGRSLRPLLEGVAPRDWRTSMFYTYYENSWTLAGKGREALSDPSFQYFTAHRVSPHRGVRTTRHKLIDYYMENGYRELFDLEQDPHELKNVYGDASYAMVQGELEKELMRLRAEFKSTDQAGITPGEVR